MLEELRNNNAFLERLRHQVDENKVGMSLLVHHAFPDELELANGVATLDTRGLINEAGPIILTLISQTGAVSVTNPEDESTPEELMIEISPPGAIRIPSTVARYYMDQAIKYFRLSIAFWTLRAYTLMK
ncbi:MAG: hypothetical protein GY809_13920 [Planctomycetes bacterium]|nr:hypothetical protein [Planctomycetota bacterium]